MFGHSKFMSHFIICKIKQILRTIADKKCSRIAVIKANVF